MEQNPGGAEERRRRTSPEVLSIAALEPGRLEDWGDAS
jgi:hypothetical protein